MTTPYRIVEVFDQEIVDGIFWDVLDEVGQQENKWGVQSHPAGTGSRLHRFLSKLTRKNCNQAAAKDLLTWQLILKEEVYEALAEADNTADLEKELIQSAAVIVSWLRDLRTR